MSESKRKQLVNKDVIVQRSKVYGNNFPLFAQLLKNFFKTKFSLQIQIQAEDVAFILSLLKISRLSNTPSDEDTMIDFINYSWLGVSYKQYIQLLNGQCEKGNKNFGDYKC